MSRELKFRAWLGSIYEMSRIFGVKDLAGISGLLTTKVEIMQFTGLLDKNEKEIYDGDLLLIDRHRIVKVCWHNELAMFDACYISDTDPSIIFRGVKNMEYSTRAEVIGNIYENPEMTHQNDPPKE